MVLMYSNEIEKALEAESIKVWDTVRITKSGEAYEGILMPRTEAGDADILVIKQKDGYNIGISFKGAAISKVSSLETMPQGRGATASAQAKAKAPAAPGHGAPKVALLYTGGTIGNKVDYKTGGVYALTKPEELLNEVPELGGIAEIDAKKLFSIASEDLSESEWVAIADAAAKALNGGAKGVVVTIGTDTMHYASAALSFMLQGLNAPVVLTGAQRSSDRGSSDGFLNLICSAYLASRSDIAEVGICMHDTSSDQRCALIRGTKARKMHTSRRDAFRAVNSAPIAFADARGNLTYNGQYKRASPGGGGAVKAVTGLASKVALVKVYPSSDPGIIGYYRERGYTGMIIEGTGLGHVPNFTSEKSLSWLPAITEAIDCGMVVGMTSQCLYGRVNPNVYRTLRMLSAAGVVYCEDMLPEVAYVKLKWLLGNHGPEEARKQLPRNLAGEITERIEYSEFPE